MVTGTNQAQQGRNILSISSLNAIAKNVLEREIGKVWLRAEISNFVAASSGHWYLTLKDNKAQVKGAMFRGANSRVSIRPKNGDNVLVRANISLYEPRGDYQIIIEHLELDGEGLLKQRFEQLKNQLASEGLFATQTKKALPQQVNKVGIVTSSTGAALHDIITVLQHRNPAISVIIYPTMVQGEQATRQIAKAIHIANQRNEVDVLIVGRGGGSLEDLWCFNEEEVARAIFASRLPIISAVGHEVDVSIADFVADVRAATPSQAAELVSRDQSEFVNKVHNMQQRLQLAMEQRITQAQYQLEVRQAKLNRHHPQQQLQRQSQSIDRLEIQLKQSMQRLLKDEQRRVSTLEQALLRNNPALKVQEGMTRLQQLEVRLQRAQASLIDNNQLKLSRLADLLNSVSPLATLGRGYSITKRGDKVVSEAAHISSGDELTTKFVDGEVKSRVL